MRRLAREVHVSEEPMRWTQAGGVRASIALRRRLKQPIRLNKAGFECEARS